MLNVSAYQTEAQLRNNRDETSHSARLNPYERFFHANGQCSEHRSTLCLIAKNRTLKPVVALMSKAL